jgi:hypothetical protein
MSAADSNGLMTGIGMRLGIVRINATDLFRALAAGLVLLFAFALSGMSALACNERQEVPHPAVQASLTLSSLDLSGATVGAPEVDAADRVAEATADPRARSSDLTKHCPCGGSSHCPCGGSSHCACAAGSAVVPSPMSSDLHSAPGRLRMPLQALLGGLPKSPEERPPRQT